MFVYAVRYNPFIHESADALISIHASKSGAWKALRRFIWDECVAAREAAIMDGWDTLYKPEWTRHYVEMIEVQP